MIIDHQDALVRCRVSNLFKSLLEVRIKQGKQQNFSQRISYDYHYSKAASLLYIPIKINFLLCFFII